MGVTLQECMVCKRVTNHNALVFFVSHAATRDNGQAANHYVLFDMREHLVNINFFINLLN